MKKKPIIGGRGQGRRGARGGGETAPGALRKWLLVNRKMASDNGLFDFLDGFFNIIISIIYSMRKVGEGGRRGSDAIASTTAQFKLRNGQD